MLTPEATITPGPKHIVTFGRLFTFMVPEEIVALPDSEPLFTIHSVSLLLKV